MSRVDKIVFIKFLFYSFFKVKVSQILQKVIVFFLEKGNEIKTSF